MIEYTDSTHTYTYEGKELLSVTTLLKNLSPPFRGEYWSRYKALQALGHEVKSDASRGVPIDFYLIDGEKVYYRSSKLLLGRLEDERIKLQQSWKDKSKSSTNNGTYLHNQIEKAFRGNVVEEEFINSFVKSKQYLVPIHLETVVYDIEHGLSGTMDALFFNKTEQYHELHDHKTDAEIKRENKFQKFLPPISHLDCCNYIKHCLQLNLYRHCVKLNFDIDVQAMYINQIKENEIIQHPVPIMEKEVRLILNSLKK